MVRRVDSLDEKQIMHISCCNFDNSTLSLLLLLVLLLPLVLFVGEEEIMGLMGAI